MVYFNVSGMDLYAVSEELSMFEINRMIAGRKVYDCSISD